MARWERGLRCRQEMDDLHEVALKELLQPLLGCRVGQVADVKTAAISRAGGIGGLVRDGGSGQSGGHIVDGSVSGVGGLLSRHG